MLSNLYRNLFEQMPLIVAILWLFFTVFGAYVFWRLEKLREKNNG